MGFIRYIALIFLIGWGSAQAGDNSQTLAMIQRMLPMEAFFPGLEENASLGRISDWGWEINNKIKSIPFAIREVNQAISTSSDSQKTYLQEYSTWLAKVVMPEVDTTIQQTTKQWATEIQAALRVPSKAKKDKGLRSRLDQAWLALEHQSAFEHGYHGEELENTRQMRDKLAEVEGKWAGLKDKIYKKYAITPANEDNAAISEVARQALAMSEQSAAMGQPVVQNSEQDREGIVAIGQQYYAISWQELEALALEHAPDGEYVRVVLLRNYNQSPPGLLARQWYVHRSWRLGTVDIATAETLSEDESK